MDKDEKDFEEGLSVGKDLEKRYLPKTRSQKAIDMAYARIERAVDNGEITKGQYTILDGMISEMAKGLSVRSADQKKQKKAEYKEVSGDIAFLKKRLLQGDPRPYPTFTLQSIVDHLQEVAKLRAGKGQRGDWREEIDWTSIAELLVSENAYSVSKSGEVEDKRLPYMMDKLTELGWGVQAEQMTAKEVEQKVEQARGEALDILSSTDGIAKALDHYRAWKHRDTSDPYGPEPLEAWHIELIVKKLTDEYEGEDLDRAIRTETFYNGGGDRLLENLPEALDEFLADYEGVLNVMEAKKEALAKQMQIAEAEARAKAQAEAERKAQAKPDRWGKLTPDEERFSDIVERAVDGAMKGIERRLEKLESEVKATTEQLQRAVDKLKEKGVAPRMTPPKKSMKQPQFMMPKHFEITQGEVKMTQSPFMETCWACNQEQFNVWSMDVQRAFEDMPSFPKGRAARYYWHTCEKCKRDNKTGWVWVEMPSIEHFTFNAMIDPGFYNRVDEHNIPKQWIINAVMEVWVERKGGMISTYEIERFLGWEQQGGTEFGL